MKKERNKNTFKVKEDGESNNKIAKTRFINHSNIRMWISFSFGLLVSILGLILFLFNTENYYFIALMLVGAFIMSMNKPDLSGMLSGKP